MNSSRETNSTAMNVQKKNQKTNKKQKQKQLLYKQQQLINGTKITDLKHSQLPLTISLDTTSGQEKKSTAKDSLGQTKQQQNNASKNNNINSIQNINKSNINDSYYKNSESTNIIQKLNEYNEIDQRKADQETPISTESILVGFENCSKIERSNSFSIRNKFSKLLNSIKSSKENLTKTTDIGENVKAPYSFTRSRSMILLRRPNRRSLIEPQLGQLSEETEKLNDNTMSSPPYKNVMVESGEQTTVQSKGLYRRADSSFDLSNAQPSSLSSKEEIQLRSTLQRNPSLVSLPLTEGTFNPQLNFQKRRSNTLIASFKSTFSGLAGSSTVTDKKKEKMNPKWSASLQSLQAIDNMVSYENMSFIDYDKFNGYEKQLDRQLSALSLRTELQPQAQFQMPSPPSTILNDVSTVSPTGLSMCPPPCSTLLQKTPNTVIHRRKLSSSSLAICTTSFGSLQDSLNFGVDSNHNFDKLRNVYRNSLDSQKLELLNKMSRNSIIFDNHMINDPNLEDNFEGKLELTYRDRKTYSEISCSSVQDAVDGCNGVQTSGLGYFLVSFLTESSFEDEELLEATKGVSLLSAITKTLEKHNLSFSEVNIFDITLTASFLESGLSPLTKSLEENMDTGNLTGRRLLIIKRNTSKATLEKVPSFILRTCPSSLLSSEMINKNSVFANTIGKQIKPRLTGFFSQNNTRQHELIELLNSYAKNCMLQKPSMLNFNYPHFNLAQSYLNNMHNTWRDFVEIKDMSDNKIKIQIGIWELVTTEVFYIHALKTMTDLFSAYLKAVQEEGFLTDVDQHKLFSNVHDILKSNLKFWTIYLYPMVAHSVVTREPMQYVFFQEGFKAFSSIFAAYKKYCTEQSTCQLYCKGLSHTNPLFSSYLTWCESQKMCNRLRLVDILVRPMQRLTKYNLLLAAIKKNMENVTDIEEVNIMMHSVEDFICSVNNHIIMRQENERLKGVMARIESYDVVKTNNDQLDILIKQYSKVFDLCAPMKGCLDYQVRHLFMEGDHKLKDNLGKVDVHCFLLTDILLICKEIGKKGHGALKVIRQPYLTDRLVIQYCATNKTLNCIYLNEFQVTITAFTLQCSEAKNWFEALRRAKTIYTRLKNGTSGNWDDFSFGEKSISSSCELINTSNCIHASNANSSHSSFVDCNTVRNNPIQFEKTNSLSSDEGCTLIMDEIKDSNENIL